MPQEKNSFLYHQPKWRGRKTVRRFVAALAIGAASLSLHYVYKRNTEGVGWTRETVVRSVDGDHRAPEVLSVTVFLLNGTTTWTVPADFFALVSVECIGAGSSGNSVSLAANRASGGGGAYAKITTTSTTLTPGVTSINVGIGLGGATVTVAASNAGGDTWWNATSRANAATLTSAVACAAQGGQAAASATGGLGGTAATSTGTTRFSGGNGFAGTSGGGGGSGGPSGAGSTGAAGKGGNADGGVVIGPSTSSTGNSGTEFDATHGCGTGALSISGVGFAGGLYGGGGCSSSSGSSGPGANGLIVIIYTPPVVLGDIPNSTFLTSRKYGVVAY